MTSKYIASLSPVDYDPFALTGVIEQVIPLDEAQRKARDQFKSTSERFRAADSATKLLPGALNPSVLELALDDLVRRRRNLRAIFSPDLNQVMFIRRHHVPLLFLDLSHLSFAEAVAALEELQNKESLTAFDLQNGPLARLLVVQTPANASHLIFTVHKLASATCPVATALTELLEFYDARMELRKPRLSLHEPEDDLTPHEGALDARTFAAIVHGFNQTAKPYPSMSLPGLIQRAALEHSHRVAVVFQNETMTYRALDEKSSRLAAFLRDKGVRPGDIVGIALERGFAMVIALIAALKAGAAYLPMDPGYPVARLNTMLQRAKARLILAEERLMAVFSSSSTPLYDIEQANQEAARHPPSWQEDDNFDMTNLAYVMYTSGSTGEPKGVAISHRAVVNFLHAIGDAIGVTQDDCILALTTISFDISVLEIFLTLAHGAKMILLERMEAQDGTILARKIMDNGVSVMQATPASFRLLMGCDWQGKKDLTVICGGESFPREIARYLVPRVKKVWNAYGPTEATVWATLFPITDADAPILIGRPLPNYKAFILDKKLQPVPIGQSGDLYLGGLGLAQGYLHQEELTRERFFPNPFTPGERIYDTGDIARFCPHGAIEFLARRDDQVKIRGYRIELREIEAVVNRHPAVRQGVVSVHENAAGDKQLVCHAVLHNGQKLDNSALHAWLAQFLPDYMLPGQLMILDAIPLAANGKVNRKALPAQPDLTTKQQPALAPRTRTEIHLARIWTEQLGIENIAVSDNFFEIGGHSLLAMRVVTAINRVAEPKIGIRDLLANSLEQLAAMIVFKSKG